MRVLAITSTTLGILVAAVLLVLLVRTNSELNTSESKVEAGQVRIEQLTADLGAVTERLNEETVSLESSNARLAVATAENAGLKAELGVTTEQLAAQTTRNETLTADLLASSEQLGSKTAENKALTDSLETVTRQLADKTTEHNTLLQEVGTLASLRADKGDLLGEVDSLRSLIRELEKQREPLLVQSDTLGFRCTGSMEPKITCLDSATWLRNFNPEDISTGTVIVFTPTPECELGESVLSHRVIDIRESEGTYYYWPKGDANPEADGCWVPDTNVYGYMIELHKDTHPENTDLRNRVNAAKTKRDETFEEYMAAQEAYNQRYQQYCGHNPDACSLDSERVAELDTLYDEYIRLFNVHQEAYEAWNTVFQEAWTTY